MSKDSSRKTGFDAWYSYDGPENDVVLSTRVRLARNLANFPFTTRFRGDDSERVQALVFDSFSQCENPDSYQAIAVEKLDVLGKSILKERGVIEESTIKGFDTGVVMREDGKLSCTVNDIDHVRISSFVPGLNAEQAFDSCKALDDSLQNYLQFAASLDFGFLTANVKDAGSGLKASCRVHLPSVSFSGGIFSLYNFLKQKGIELSAVYGSGHETGTSLGCFYQLSTLNAGCGSEFDQMASLISAVRYVLETERRMRENLLLNKKTVLSDKICRSYAIMKFASLISLNEAICLISDLKWGKALNLIDGIKDSELCASLYRIQEGHLSYLLSTRKLTFPMDVEQDQKLKINRLRSVVVQEVFENVVMK